MTGVWEESRHLMVSFAGTVPSSRTTALALPSYKGQKLETPRFPSLDRGIPQSLCLWCRS